MIGIFLDDERYPSDVTWVNYPSDIEWHIVRTYEEFTSVLCNVNMDEVIVSFDHDIQDFSGVDSKELTGYDCLKYLVNLCLDLEWDIPMCYFHTQNVVGKKNMEQYYINAINFQERNNQ